MTATLPLKPVGPPVLARVPENWQADPITRFAVVPMSPTIGAEIEGVDLREPLDPELHHQLHQALLEWKVIFFRDQDVTDEQHTAFAANWGPLESHPFLPEGSTDLIVRFAKDANVRGYENEWHSDVSWRVLPSLGSVLRAVEIPPVGGDTLFADMAAAYDNLADDIKARIDDRTAVHDWVFSFGLGMTPEAREAFRERFPAVEHPVVRTHPETGARSIYVNRFFTDHIVGIDREDSDTLLQHLYRQAAVPEYQCRFRWRPNSIAFWDNRAVQHYAASDYHPQRRVMQRVTVIGDRPR